MVNKIFKNKAKSILLYSKQTFMTLQNLIDHLEEIRDDWARKIEEENSYSLFEETDDE